MKLGLTVVLLLSFLVNVTAQGPVTSKPLPYNILNDTSIKVIHVGWVNKANGGLLAWAKRKALTKAERAANLRPANPDNPDVVTRLVRIKANKFLLLTTEGSLVGATGSPFVKIVPLDNVKKISERYVWELVYNNTDDAFFFKPIMEKWRVYDDRDNPNINRFLSIHEPTTVDFRYEYLLIEDSSQLGKWMPRVLSGDSIKKTVRNDINDLVTKFVRHDWLVEVDSIRKGIAEQVKFDKEWENNQRIEREAQHLLDAKQAAIAQAKAEKAYLAEAAERRKKEKENTILRRNLSSVFRGYDNQGDEMAIQVSPRGDDPYHGIMKYQKYGRCEWEFEYSLDPVTHNFEIKLKEESKLKSFKRGCRASPSPNMELSYRTADYGGKGDRLVMRIYSIKYDLDYKTYN